MSDAPKTICIQWWCEVDGSLSLFNEYQDELAGEFESALLDIPGVVAAGTEKGPSILSEDYIELIEIAETVASLGLGAQGYCSTPLHELRERARTVLGGKHE